MVAGMMQVRAELVKRFCWLMAWLGTGSAVFPGMAVAESGDLLWAFDSRAPIFASPTVSPDGVIYIGSNASTCTALNPTGGEPEVRWTYSADDWIDATVALGEDGTVYVGTYNFTLAALDPDSGEAKWEITLGENLGLFGVVQASPAITVEGDIIVSTSAGVMHAILPTGEERWSFDFGADTRSSPAIGADGRIYFGADDGLLRCLNASGELEWSFSVDGAGEEDSRIHGSPSIDGDGNVYVGAGNGFLYSVDASGALRWRFDTPEAVDNCPAIDAENQVYFALRNGSLYCVDQASEEVWSYFLGDIFFSSPVLDQDGFVYITYSAGGGESKVVALAPGGVEVWATAIESVIDSSLVVTPEGQLIVRGFDGKLYALERRAALDYEAPWARFRRDTRGRGRVVEGTLPVVVEGLAPLAVPANGVGRFTVKVEGGEQYAWRRDGSPVASTEEAFPPVGPVGLEDVANHAVVVSNDVGEILLAPAALIQLGHPQWVSRDGTSGLAMSYTYPLSAAETLELTSDR